MTSLSAALDLVAAKKPAWGEEAVPCDQAAGRALARDIVAGLDSPRFDNSAMDGWAVGSEGTGPWRVVGEVAAGTSFGRTLSAGHAARIFTGAPVPPGAVAVVPLEEALLNGQILTANGTAQPGAHVRPRGGEFRAGSVVLSEGTVVTPPVTSALAALGMSEVRVYRTPNVSVVATGSELAVAGGELGPAGVWESNSPGLVALLRYCGCSVTSRLVTDDLDLTCAAIAEEAGKCDIVVTVGGVSVGAYDFVKQAAIAAGFDPVFCGVKMKPGKPTCFGVRPDGKAWFGLPGNPYAALASAVLFLLPFIGQGKGFAERTSAGRLSRKPGREEVVPARIVPYTGGFEFLPAVGSYSVLALCGADLLVRVPAELSEVRQGDQLLTTPLPWRTPCLG